MFNSTSTALDLSQPMRSLCGKRVVYSTRKKDRNDPAPIIVLLAGETWPQSVNEQGIVEVWDKHGNRVFDDTDVRCIINGVPRGGHHH